MFSTKQLENDYLTYFFPRFITENHWEYSNIYVTCNEKVLYTSTLQ